MADSLRAARDTVTELLVTDGGPHADLVAAGVVRVYSYEPGIIEDPSVAVVSAGMTADDYRLEVRVYRPLTDLDMAAAQNDLDRMLAAVDARLYTDAIVETPNWEIDYVPDPTQLWFAVGQFQIPREDTHYQ